jgi:uncharacterized membrane protein YjjB (DUF3815 family)
MHIDAVVVAHQTLFGSLAAMGFGVLFNVSQRHLLWCGVAGGLALAVRTLGLQLGGSLESASFAAALSVGAVAQMFQEHIGISRNTLDVTGCIPMVPGGFAAKAILGLFALTAPTPIEPDKTLIISVEYFLRVTFTIGAIGTGLAIPSLLLKAKQLAVQSIPRPSSK